VTVHIIVEGQTEKDFVEKILKKELKKFGVHTTVSLLGRDGGSVTFERLKTDVKHTMTGKYDYVTTMLDYYGSDNKWPGKGEIEKLVASGTSISADKIGEMIEGDTLDRMVKELPDLSIKEKFIPYFQMYEFEALLFSDPEVLAVKLQVNQKYIDDIVSKFPTPEDINNSVNTAPSKRLDRLNKEHSKSKQGYKKRIQGIEIVEATGLETISKECTHFRKWFERIKGLANSK
jgi:hypothetical protein